MASITRAEIRRRLMRELYGVVRPRWWQFWRLGQWRDWWVDRHRQFGIPFSFPSYADTGLVISGVWAQNTEYVNLGDRYIYRTYAPDAIEEK